MSREQQGVVLFLGLSLCLLFFLTGPLPAGRTVGGGADLPASKPGERQFPVEIDGPVGRRGVIAAQEGMTVLEALEKAGGVQAGLSLPEEILSRKIDRSSRLSVLAEEGERGKVAIEPLAPQTLRALGVPVSLNRASAEELDILPGVGPRTARAIVEFREKHGKFQSPEDLLRVPGIGPKKLQALRPHISLP